MVNDKIEKICDAYKQLLLITLTDLCKTANQYMTVSKKKNIEVARIKLEHSVAISDFC